ncbi:hypothetical protein [Flavivirga spongiicola]|uniref:Lipid/polyisoprenoid-binding YceI-like domain-containing protein n=1 Tax=Flavivirga spongiicola TaxID=421621 RepID=A0ABU7XVE2_9FLAO|nr:hypothetical protein [Flavivirga sp. MEBiC05379]MDO5979385.1 hypothetical protein [Flavivirga sp. MEBiC05379]
MKLVIKYMFLLFLGFCFGCDELEELFEEEIEVQSTFITELEVNVPNGSTPDEAMNFESNFGVWNFAEDPNIVDFLGSPDEITKIEINSVRYFFKNVQGNPDAFVEGQITFSVGQGGESFDTVVTNLAQADFNNTLFTLDGDFSNVNTAITMFRSIGFLYHGSVSDNPVSFITDVSITVTVTIKPSLDNL